MKKFRSKLNPKCKKCLCKIGARNQSGFCGKCRDKFCRKDYHKKYYSIEVNRKRRSETTKAWAKANPERHREKSLRWQKENPERVKKIRFKTMSGLTNRFTRAKHQAKKRGFCWAITKEEYAQLLKCVCNYCSGPLNLIGVGLDRIDNEKGYELGNILPCCGTCNKIRGDRLTRDEMVVAMNAVLELRKLIKEDEEWRTSLSP